MLELMLRYDELCRKALAEGADLNKLIRIEVKERIARAKTVPMDEYEAAYAAIGKDMAAQIAEITAGGAEA